MAIPQTVTPTRPGQTALVFATEATLLATTLPSGTFSYALDTGAAFMTDASGTSKSLSANLMTFDAADAELPVANPAAVVQRNDHNVLAFDAGTDEFANFKHAVPDSYRGGTITAYVDWAADSATAGDVVWTMAFERLNAGADIATNSFAAARTVTTTTAGTAGFVSRSTLTFTQAQADAVAALDSFRLQVSRDADNAADTMVGDAQLVNVVLKF